MSVKETLELDIRRAMAQASELGAAYKAQLEAAGKGLEVGLGGSTGQLKAGAEAANSIGVGLRGASTEATRAAQGLSQVGAAGRDGAASIALMGPAADHAAAELYQYQLAQRRTRDEERQSNEERKQSAAAMKEVGTQAGIAAAAITAGLGFATVTTMRFDQQLSMLGAVSDASANRMGRLRDAALEAGAATVFSASEAAQAETELAKAGISTGDILSGALRGSLNLAAAGQLDLARAAEISAQAMKIFQLKGADVGHIADVLAAGANKSTASVESLAQGLENVGGVAARLFNTSLEETVGTLALFDANALRGAEGGTALRSALLALATPTDKQTKAMQAVNLEVFDAQGKFVGLSKLAGNLQEAFVGASDESRNLALGVIFGSYGIRAANILYQEGEAGVRKWTKAVDDQGAAQRFASKSLDNLAGDMEQLRGAIETGLIGAGSQGTSVLRFMAQRATDAARGLSDLPGPAQAGAGGLAALTAAGLAAVFVAGTIIPKWQSVSEALGNTGKMGQFAADHMGQALKVAGGAATAVTSFQMIGQSAESSALGIAGMAAAGAAIGSVFPGYGTAIGAAAGATIGFGKALFDSGESAEEFAAKVDGLTKQLIGLSDAKSAKVFLDEIGESANDMALNFRAAALDQTEFLRQGGIAEFRTSWLDAGKQVDEYEKKFAALAKKNPAQAEAVLNGLRKIRDENGRLAIPEDVITKMESQLKRGRDAYAESAKRAKDAADSNQDVATSLDVSGDAADAAAKSYEDYVKALASGTPTVSSFFDNAVSAAQAYADKQKEAFSPDVLLWNLGQQMGALAGFTSNVKLLMSEGLTDLAALVAEKGPVAGATLAQALADASPEVRAAIEASVDAGNTELQAWNDYLNGSLAPELKGTAFAMGFGVGSGTSTGLGASTPTVETTASTVAAHAIWALGAVTDTEWMGKAAGDGISLGLDKSVGAAVASATSLADQVLASIRDAFAFGSPSKVMRRYGRWASEGLALGITDGGSQVDAASSDLGMRSLAGVQAGLAAADGIGMVGTARRGGGWRGERGKPGWVTIQPVGDSYGAARGGQVIEAKIDVIVQGVSDPAVAARAGKAAGDGVVEGLHAGVARRMARTNARVTLGG